MLAKIKDLLLTKALTVLGGWLIAMPNEDFPANPLVKFVVISWFPAEPDRRYNGTDDPHFYQGILQILVNHPKGGGIDALMDDAQAIADAFAVGEKLVDKAAGITIKIDREPAIGSAYENDRWFAAPVSIRYSGTPWRKG